MNASEGYEEPTRESVKNNYGVIRYNFDGWYSDEALTKPVSELTKITGNQTLFAKWQEEATYQRVVVKFDANTKGEKVSNLPLPQVLKTGELAAKPQVEPTREPIVDEQLKVEMTKYKFLGWTTERDPKQPVVYWDFSKDTLPEKAG